MRNLLFLPILFFALAPLGKGSAFTTTVFQNEVQIIRNLIFGSEGGEKQLLDLYLPTTEEALRPAIVFIHGGGWSGGDKGGWAKQAEEMAKLGYVAISINYRLAPKHKYPAAVIDSQGAVRWLKINSEKYRIDPERIGSMGDSAGGHLAAMLGVRETYPNSAPKDAFSSKVNCVVDYYGRMDLVLSGGAHDYRPDFIGKSLPEGETLYREASPITYVSKTSAPFLIVQGARDPQVEPAQSYKMIEALDRAGVEATLIVISKQGHGFSGVYSDEAWSAAKGFFSQRLMSKKH